MSEVIQWAKLTPEERDRLVAEKVMGWDPNAPCMGRWVPLDPEPDGLYCTGCGAEIGWGTKEWADHHDQPRAKAYTQSMDLAWQVVEKMKQDGRNSSLFGRWGYYLDYLYSRPAHRDVLYDIDPSGICLAALRACGVKIEN